MITLDEIDVQREKLKDLIDKRRLLESQGKHDRDLYRHVVAEIATRREYVERSLDERRRFPLATLGERIGRWVTKCFGAPNLANRNERALRVVEEAIELAQAEGVKRAVVQAIVTRVFERPVGTIRNESAGLLLTLAAWQVNTRDVNVFEEAEMLLYYLDGVDPDHFRRKHAAKVEAGVAMPATPPEVLPYARDVRPPE